jgi:hypothetical protein
LFGQAPTSGTVICSYSKHQEKMEMSNLVSVAVFLALIIIPVWLLVRSSNKKKRQLLAKANKLRAENAMNFTESDTWDNAVIGLDKATKKLLWFKEKPEGGHGMVLKLKDFSQCKKVNVSRSAQVGNDSSQVVDQLGLELIAKEGKAAPLLLEFYNSKDSYLLSTQLELQSKWQQQIAESLGA